MKLQYLLPVTLLLLVGCASKTDRPSGVAYDFWLAEKAQEPDKAAKLTLKEDTEAAKLHNKIKIVDAKFDDPVIKGEEAIVPTTLVLKDFSPLSHDTAAVSFDTKMRKSEQGWRVDMFETKKALYMAAGKSYAQTLGKDFANTVQQALGDSGEIQSIFKQLIQGIQKAIDAGNKTN